MRNPHKKVIFISVIAIIAMFGFTFALVPIYSVFCKVTGLNGKVDINQRESFEKHAFARYQSDEALVSGRIIVVEFDVNRNRELNCDITPQHTVLQVKPGELALTSYHVKNLTNKTLIIQAIPSISPGIAAKHLKKLECFCFNQQILKPYESMDLPLRFWLEPEIPDTVKRLTLSYTLFDVTQAKKETQGDT